MRLFRKRSLVDRSDASNDPSAAADRLRTDIAALEQELTESTRVLADIEKRMAANEARAMEAIRAGDDAAARRFLVDMQVDAEKLAAVGADLKVLRATLDECYDFLDKAPGASQREPR